MESHGCTCFVVSCFVSMSIISFTFIIKIMFIELLTNKSIKIGFMKVLISFKISTLTCLLTTRNPPHKWFSHTPSKWWVLDIGTYPTPFWQVACPSSCFGWCLINSCSFCLRHGFKVNKRMNRSDFTRGYRWATKFHLQCAMCVWYAMIDDVFFLFYAVQVWGTITVLVDDGGRKIPTTNSSQTLLSTFLRYL